MARIVSESNKMSRTVLGMSRRVEVWRPVGNLRSENSNAALQFAWIGGVKMALVDIDDGFADFDDLVVDGGLDALCSVAFDGGVGRCIVFDYVAVGTDGTAPASSQTALGGEVLRVQGTYGKDVAVGECSVDATFNITGTYALQECGLFNAASDGVMYCRDTFTTKNVVSGDTVKVYYTPKFQRPS